MKFMNTARQVRRKLLEHRQGPSRPGRKGEREPLCSCLEGPCLCSKCPPLALLFPLWRNVSRNFLGRDWGCACFLGLCFCPLWSVPLSTRIRIMASGTSWSPTLPRECGSWEFRLESSVCLGSGPDSSRQFCWPQATCLSLSVLIYKGKANSILALVVNYDK